MQKIQAYMELPFILAMWGTVKLFLPTRVPCKINGGEDKSTIKFGLKSRSKKIAQHDYA